MSYPRVSHLSDQRQTAGAINHLLLASQRTVVARSATSTETQAVGECIVLASGTITINLPTAVGNTCRYTVKMMTAASTVTIDANAAETIDGAATVALTVQYESRTLVSDGSNWVIV